MLTRSNIKFQLKDNLRNTLNKTIKLKRISNKTIN